MARRGGRGRGVCGMLLAGTRRAGQEGSRRQAKRPAVDAAAVAVSGWWIHFLTIVTGAHWKYPAWYSQFFRARSGTLTISVRAGQKPPHSFLKFGPDGKGAGGVHKTPPLAEAWPPAGAFFLHIFRTLVTVNTLISLTIGRVAFGVSIVLSYEHMPRYVPDL